MLFLTSIFVTYQILTPGYKKSIWNTQSLPDCYVWMNFVWFYSYWKLMYMLEINQTAKLTEPCSIQRMSSSWPISFNMRFCLTCTISPHRFKQNLPIGSHYFPSPADHKLNDKQWSLLCSISNNHSPFSKECIWSCLPCIFLWLCRSNHLGSLSKSPNSIENSSL